MYEDLAFRIEGSFPLLMHNCRRFLNLTDPLTSEFGPLSKKGGKRTDAENVRLSRIEWELGLYLDADGKPCVPADLIFSMLVAGAKKSKMGQQFLSGLIIEQDFPLIYDGPKDVDEMWKSGKFVDVRPVKMNGGRSTIMRTRPRFDAWALDVQVHFLPDVIKSKDAILAAATDAGRLIGLGDYRPRFGRFAVAA